ncbi:MAG: DUF5709 domain-containing protein [Pseudonocardia sp.]|nr:DUF5709 domain-containing protein [Pseudonocardia sp.]
MDRDANGPEDDSDQLQPEDTLDGRSTDDVLDEGYSPPERPWNADEHENLDERLSEELPDFGAEDDAAADGLGDTSDTDGELRDDQVGGERAGRLVASDEGGVRDTDSDAWAEDIGIDGAGASAEEAAVHVVDDES